MTLTVYLNKIGLECSAYPADILFVEAFALKSVFRLRMEIKMQSKKAFTSSFRLNSDIIKEHTTVNKEILIK